MSDTSFLRMPALERKTGRKRSAIYGDIAAGRFPRPVKIGPRASAWISSEVDEWMAERIRASRPEVGATRDAQAAAGGGA